MRCIFFKWLMAFLAVSVFVVGCRKGPEVNQVNVEFKLVPFYMDLHSIPLDSVAEYVPRLQQKYGSFLDAYSEGVIHVGAINAPGYADYLKSFIEYAPNRDVFDTCKIRYANTDDLYRDIKTAFQHYRFYFNEAQIPDVYMHISGFNQSMVVDSGIVAVSIEKYLGADCQFYEWLSFPLYLRKKMMPEKIVPDIMKAIAMTEFPLNDSVNDVVNHVIYQGKLAYFVRQMVPEIHDSLLFDYSEKELDWCRSNEAQMWATLVENKHLFNTEQLVIQKYTGDAPFTAYFGQNSPGHAGVFLGYRLVEAYMKNNEGLTLKDLMTQNDSRFILSKSGYRP